MKDKLFLGIDIGTTSLKAAVFDMTGKRRAMRCVDYTLDTDAATGFIEFDADKYVSMCREVIASLKEECGDIEAFAIDTQGETMILTDADGKPLCPAIVWLDNRATAEADEIKDCFGREKVYNVTGQPEITATWPAAKLMWVKKNRPEVFKKTEKIFMLEDWVMYSLTGEFVTEPTIQSSTIYFDVLNKKWWGEMLDFVGINEAQLPKVVVGQKVIGEYDGIKAVTGALDQIAGTIGCGITDETKVSEMTGTIMAICVMTDKLPAFKEDSIIPCHLHAIDGKFCLIMWSSTAGMALKWFKNNFAESFSFADLDKIAAEVAPGCDGMTVLPYLCGSTMPKYAPDAKATFSGVTLSHTRAHFARAIMESIAFTLRQDLEYVGQEGIEEIRITGGGASSKLWSQIKADVTGKELRTVTESETACLGSAILAAVGAGAFDSIKTAAEALVGPDKTYAPCGDDYTEAYRRYCELDDLLV